MVLSHLVHVQNGETKTQALSERVTLEGTGITSPGTNLKEGKELTCIQYVALIIQQTNL